MLVLSLSAVLVIFNPTDGLPIPLLTTHNNILYLHSLLVADRLASVGAMVWIGLNHLKDGWGWQWSDGAPLSLVNFTTGTDYWFAPEPSERTVSAS